MIEDKLTRAQRVRLESLAQAIAAGAMRREDDAAIIARAERFEAFLKAARDDA